MRSPHQLDLRHEDTYLWELWQLCLLLCYWSRLLFYSVQIDIVAPFHLARLKGRVCLFVVSIFACIVTRQVLLWFYASALYSIVLSANVGKSVLNFLTVLILPFSAGYFPKMYLSFSVHLWYCDCRFTDFGEATWSLITCMSMPTSEVVAACGDSIMWQTKSVKISHHIFFHYICWIIFLPSLSM